MWWSIGAVIRITMLPTSQLWFPFSYVSLLFGFKSVDLLQTFTTMKSFLLLLALVPMFSFSQCFMNYFYVNVESCDPVDNKFDITGYVEFQFPPATGQLIVEDCNGNQQVFNAPFTSPTNFALIGIDSDGTTTGCTVTAYFTDDATCSTTSGTFNYPNPCVCTADAGTWTDTPSGSTTSTGPYKLCFGDELTVSSNGDLTYPQDFSATLTTITYDPGAWLLVYSCPPTQLQPVDINTDPCFMGIASTMNGVWDIVNNVGDGSTYWYVPITMYSMIDGIYAVSINGGDWCYDMGPAYEVTFLEEIIANEVPDPIAETVTVTVSGGMPAYDASDFTISNVQPPTAVVSQTTIGNNGTFTISNVPCAANYSFTVTDATGCTHAFSNAITGTDVISACDSYTWIDGNTYTSSNNTATYTLTNGAGCDSIVTLDLSINSNTGVDTIFACDSYTWIDGNTYTSNNNSAIYILTNIAGCDSVVTLDLTINTSDIVTDVITACDSLTWIDGITYTSSNNTATHTLTNSAGCDSIITLDLTINQSSSVSLIETAIDSYVLNGQTFSQTGIYTQTLTNTVGCDSTITLDLTVEYTGLEEQYSTIRVYPNPVHQDLHVVSDQILEGRFSIYDIRGRLIVQDKLNSNGIIEVDAMTSGVYYLVFDAYPIRLRFMKE